MCCPQPMKSVNPRPFQNCSPGAQGSVMRRARSPRFLPGGDRISNSKTYAQRKSVVWAHVFGARI